MAALMNAVPEEKPIVDPIRLIETAITQMDGARFDRLVDLRDAAQAMLDREKDRHEADLKAKSESLRKQLTESMAKLNGLESQVRAAPRAKRSDAGVKRPAKARES